MRGPHQCADRQTAACAGSQHHRSITRCETALNLLSLFGMLDVDNYFNSEFAEHSRVVAATRDQLGDPFKHLVEACVKAVHGGGKLMFFGNGGSAADAQHLATELTVRYVKNRQPIAAISLTTDTSALTAIGNDFSFDQLFARQVLALGKAGDVASGSPRRAAAPTSCTRCGWHESRASYRLPSPGEMAGATWLGWPSLS